MKNIITLALLFFSLMAQSQNFIDTHFPQYEDLEESTVIHVTAKSFELASFVIPADDKEGEELREFIASVKSVDFVSVDALANAKDEYKRGNSILENGFEELMNIKEKGNRFSFYIDQENDIVYELVGIGISEDEFFLVSVTGEMKLDVISSMISKIDSDQLKPLRKLKEYQASDFEVYPNPVRSSSSLNVTVPETLIGGQGNLYDLKGGVISTFEITDALHILNTSNMEPGTYIVSLEKESLVIKKQIVVVR